MLRSFLYLDLGRRDVILTLTATTEQGSKFVGNQKQSIATSSAPQAFEWRRDDTQQLLWNKFGEVHRHVPSSEKRRHPAPLQRSVDWRTSPEGHRCESGESLH